MALQWTDKTDGVDDVLARDVNSLASAIQIVEQSKVDKVPNKGLSSNDYTTTEKQKLAELSNYNDSEIRADIADLQDDKQDKESGKGLSSNDYTTAEKTKLGGIATGAEVNVLEGVQVDGTDQTITNKKVNIDLQTPLSGKVDIEEGKGLSTNDFTTSEKEKLAELENYDDTQIQNEIDDLSDEVSELLDAFDKIAPVDLNNVTVIAARNSATPTTSVTNNVLTIQHVTGSQSDYYGISFDTVAQKEYKIEFDLKISSGSSASVSINDGTGTIPASPATASSVIQTLNYVSRANGISHYSSIFTAVSEKSILWNLLPKSYAQIEISNLKFMLSNVNVGDIDTIKIEKIPPLADYELISNKVTSLSSLSTNTQYPGAKLVYDALSLKANMTDVTNIENLLNDKIDFLYNSINEIELSADDVYVAGKTSSEITSVTVDDNNLSLEHSNASGVFNIDFPTKIGCYYVINFQIQETRRNPSDTSSYNKASFKIQYGNVVVKNLQETPADSNNFYGEFLASENKTSLRLNLSSKIKKIDINDVLLFVTSVDETTIRYHHDFKITTPYVFVINNIGNFWLYNNGMCESDVASFDYGLKTAKTPLIVSSDAIPKKIEVITDSTVSKLSNPTDTQIIDKDLSVYLNNSLIASDKLKIKYSDMPENPQTSLNIFFLGDSLIARADSSFVPTFKSFLAEKGITNINLIGAKHKLGDNSIKYEALGGYCWMDYTEDPNDDTLPIPFWSRAHGYPTDHTNPFWINNQLDYKAYFDTYCDGASPDYIICNCAWNLFVSQYRNSIENMTSYMAAVKDQILVFIDGIHTEYPDCKIILNGMHHGCDGKISAAGSYAKSALIIQDVYMSIVNDVNYSDFVEYCDIAPYFDSDTGMQTETRYVNQFSSDTEKYVTDYVHPSDVGFKLHGFADALCFLYMLKVQQESEA